MGRNGRSGSTVVGLCEADAARQLWRGDGLEPGQAGLQYHGIRCMACACSSTCHHGERR